MKQELINCTYEQWQRYACSDPPICGNTETYGLINCTSWFPILAATVLIALVIVIIIYVISREEKR